MSLYPTTRTLRIGTLVVVPGKPLDVDVWEIYAADILVRDGAVYPGSKLYLRAPSPYPEYPVTLYYNTPLAGVSVYGQPTSYDNEFLLPGTEKANINGEK